MSLVFLEFLFSYNFLLVSKCRHDIFKKQINSKLFLFFFYFDIKYKLFIFTGMITTTTIRLDDRIKKAGQDEASTSQIRGGFSGYIELLIKADLEKKERAKSRVTPVIS